MPTKVYTVSGLKDVETAWNGTTECVQYRQPSVEFDASTLELPIPDKEKYSPSEDNRWTMRHTLLLSGLCFIKFCSYTSVFIFSSFYPPVAKSKGANGMEIGTTVGMLQGVFLPSAYLLFHYTHIIPPKAQVVWGGMTIAVSTIAFGFINRLPDTVGFVVLGYLIQIVHGIGIAASDLGIFIITNTCTPKDKVGTAVGFLEFSLAVALAGAPIIGGYLYEAEGFYISFVVAGCLVFAANLAGHFLIPDKKIERKSTWDILKHTTTFDMVIFVSHFMMGGGFTTFFAGMIEPHLSQFQLTPGTTGLVISASNAVSGITFPIWGYLCDSKLPPKYCTIIGALFVISGFVLFGPFPYLEFESTVTIMTVSLCLCGCGISGVLISAYTQGKSYLMTTCKNEEMADTVISAAYPSTYSVGSFIGAALGGMMVQFNDYRMGSACLVGIQLFGILLQIIAIRRSKKTI